MLPPRLNKISEQAVPGLICADVGTDHGYLPVFLVREGIVPSAVASDIRRGPLESAKTAVKAAGLSDRIRTVLAPGLTGIRPGEAGQCVIAGMGGLMIMGILEESPERAREMKRLILQPQNNEAELRKWLVSNGFTIERELTAAENGRYYSIIVCSPGESAPLSVFEYHTGRRGVRETGPEYEGYLTELLEKSRLRLASIERSGKSDAARLRAGETTQFIAELAAELDRLRQMHRNSEDGERE